ncbi:MAG: transcription repressor NadR [Atopobiaceae bacterium]|nr:transcription repressor NadR [Atopobiaceae bacterium]
MNGEARRAHILELLEGASGPLSGTALARACGVSRQVIVQDMALLREGGTRVGSTNRGYVLEAVSARPRRLFKVRHTDEQIMDELYAIVDLGGIVEDVVVNHRTYGRLSARLDIASRRDVKRYLDDLAASQSEPLMHVTSGYHFHHVSADSEDILDEIALELGSLGFLVERMDYEQDME